MKRIKRTLAAFTAALMASACGATTASPEKVLETARPNQAPTASVTQFAQPLQCMDRLFSDYGVSDVTVAVSGVPDFTGRAFVGSDFWLQAAISKMSQRSRAFKVTDYNPNQLATEQGLWSMSDKSGFYIPAYYIRGAISGFANNVIDNRANAGIGDDINTAGIGSSAAYSTVSVDLSVGNLLQRTLINRAHAGNEVVLESRSSGAQLGGVLSTFGANFEIVGSRNDGIPQAVRALVELNAIEILGRLTGVPYWSCLGAEHDAPSARRAQEDIFYDMSDAERIVFTQRRLARMGYYTGALNGAPSPQLSTAVSQYRTDIGQGSSGVVDLALYSRLTDHGRDKNLTAAARTTTPQAPQAPAVLPDTSAVDPNAKPPLAFNVSLSNLPTGSVGLNLSTNQTAFAYCYIEEQSGNVARIFPNRFQPDPLIAPDAETMVPPDRPDAFSLVVPESGKPETIACFASRTEIGASLPQNLRVNDLTPMPVGSLNDLTTIFQNNSQKVEGGVVIRQQKLAPR